MKTTLTRIEEPYLFEFKSADGNTCLMESGPDFEGTSRGIRPMELLGGALAGCIAIDVLNILKKQRMETSLFRITIDGQRKQGTPSPYEEFILTYEVDPSVDKEKLLKNIELVEEKYCSVSASLDPKIVIRHEIK